MSIRIYLPILYHVNKDFMKTLTVFTPTYNRAHTLNRVYESLKRQTCDDFEWLVIDDGSTDNTKTLLDGFIAESG